jgi:hypothetical protein
MPDRLFNDGASPRVIFRPTSKESFRGGWNDPQVKEVAAELQQRRRTAPKHLSPNRSGRHLRPFGLKMAREGMLWLW